VASSICQALPQGECGVDGVARSLYPKEIGERNDFHSDFHVFAVEWEKGSLKYFVDGEMTMELTSFHVPIIPRWPFYLILYTAVSPFGLLGALVELPLARGWESGDAHPTEHSVGRCRLTPGAYTRSP